MFSIRSAQREDVGVIHAMVCELAAYERLPVASSVKDLERELFGAAPIVEAVVGLEDDAPAACALFLHNFSSFAGKRGIYLEDLFVRPAYRRKGYGRALLSHVAQLACERGCARFEWAVLDWNAPAIDFYRSLGASVLPDWRVVRVSGAALDALARGSAAPG